MSSVYESLSVSRTFPKIAVVCGASTELGQSLLLELVHCVEIDKVHAVANSDIPVLNRLTSSLLRKVRVHLFTFDDLDRTLKKIPECDVAFCCLSTEKHAYESMGRTRFRTYNYVAPKIFVRRMFELGVLYISLLSHAKADASSSTELYRLRGELEKSVRQLRREAADFSPFISMFKVANMVSRASSSRSREKLHSDTLEYREIARAMRMDAMQKSIRRKVNATKKRLKYEEIYVADVDRLVKEAAREEDTKAFWQH